METIEAILTRRSIRKYQPEPVDEDLITRILQAAMSAPTATNQAYDFVVVRKPETLKAVGTFHPHASMLSQVPVGIAICGDPQREALPGRWIMDCSAATQNILLTAHALGLGACWVGIYPVEERIKGLRGLLALPEHVIPLCVVAIGYPAEIKKPSQRFRPELIHREKW
jgi:nitroreductase